MTTRWHTNNQMDAALCLWEYCLMCQGQDDDSVYDWLRGGEGAASARQQCIELAEDCDTSYQIAVELGYDISFDWEFVPRWVRKVMNISELGHDITRGWIEYFGRAIYSDWKKWNDVG